MLFNSYIFLFLFFPVVFCGYRLLVRYTSFQIAKAFLVLGSLYFYGYFKPSYLIILIASIVINYLLCCKIWISDRQGLRKIMLTLGCLLNVGILGYFKYTGFLLENLYALFGEEFSGIAILLPLGISFYTFQQLSFIIDAYRGDNKSISFVD